MKICLSLVIFVALINSSCQSPTKQGNDTVQNPVTTNKKISKMMDEAEYWKIVNESLKSARSQEQQLSFIETALSKEQITGFRLQTDRLLYNSYTGNLWCAAYVINGGCSDDGFQYFRCWLISKGKEAYYNAMKDPDTLISYASKDDSENEFESFWYVANDAYKQKTGKDLYDVIDPGFEFAENEYKPIEFAWSEDDPETMKKICPELFKKFWLE